jgi:hypothetical protein
MSFNMWQKLIAASTENAVVLACCEAVAAGALTDVSEWGDELRTA